MLIQEGFQVIWSPWTVLLSALIVLLLIRWFRAYRHKRAIDPVEGSYAILAVYSALVAARFYFNPTDTLLPHYVDTLFPVLVFSAVVLLPRATECWGHIRLRRSRAQAFLVLILLAYAVTSLIYEVRILSTWKPLMTPRGTVFIPSNNWSQAWTETLQYVTSHTEPKDSIVVLGANPSLYFLSECKNPLRQDYIIPGIGSSPADASEIVQRLETRQARLIVISPSIVRFSANASAYENLLPVWRYVYDHYQIRTVIGQDPWGYAIYEPLVGLSP
jgi:hypothetical protein